MASWGTDANNNRSRGSDGWESSDNRGDQGHWHHRSRDWYADAGGHWESQRWEGSRPADDRSRGPIWESQAWGDHGQVEENHSRGWEEQPLEEKARRSSPPLRLPSLLYSTLPRARSKIKTPQSGGWGAVVSKAALAGQHVSQRISRIQCSISHFSNSLLRFRLGRNTARL